MSFSHKHNGDEYQFIRKINERTKRKFCETIENTDWSVLDKYHDCQNYFSRFQDLFKNIYNKSFPIKKVKKQYRTRIPWLSVELKQERRLKRLITLGGLEIGIPAPNSKCIGAEQRPP